MSGARSSYPDAGGWVPEQRVRIIAGAWPDLIGEEGRIVKVLGRASGVGPIMLVVHPDREDGWMAGGPVKTVTLSEDEIEPIEKRCTLCGALRVRVSINGRMRFGACGLVPGADGTGGCKDPTFDCDVEAARTALDRLHYAARQVGRLDVAIADVDAIAKMIGVGGPRRRA